jgi:hypothetical protein
MRKLAVVATAVVAVFGVSAVAYAVTNTYRATAKITPSKSGTFSKPKPVKAGLSFNVGEVANLRPSPLKIYSIGLSPGIVPNTSIVKGCSSAQANAGVLPSPCSKKAKSGGANVGGGTVGALIGLPTNTSQKLTCALKVTLVNSTKKNHLWIRIDGDPPAPPGCLVATHRSIDATFVKVGSVAAKGGGPKLPSWALKFTVPPELLHNSGLDVSTVSSTTNIDTISKKVGKTTLGYLQSVGCQKTPSGKRVGDVTFTAENGNSFHAPTTGPCST